MAKLRNVRRTQRYFEAHPFEWLYRRVARCVAVAALAAGLALVAQEIAEKTHDDRPMMIHGVPEMTR